MIRTATPDDLPAVRELWLAFEEEIPDAAHRDSDSEEDLAALETTVRDGIVLLAEDDGAVPVGLAVARRTGDRVAFLDIVYVREAARRSGVAGELVREAVTRLSAAGAETLELEVLASNTEAMAIYERWGFAAGRADARRAARRAHDAASRGRTARPSPPSTCRRTTRARSSGRRTRSCRGSDSPAGRA